MGARWGRGSVSPYTGGRWRLKVSLGTDPITGKRDQRSRIVDGTRRQAEAELRRWLVELERVRPGSRDVTLRDCVTAHLADLEAHGRRATTLRRYRGLVAHVPDGVLDLPVVDVRHRHLEATYAAMPGAAASRQQLHAVLSGALRWAQRAELISTNPAKVARRPVGAGARHDPPDAAGIGALIRAGDEVSPAAGFLVRLAAATGCRRGELAALRWPDVDVAGRVLRVERAMEALPGGPVEGPTKTARSNRWLSIDDATARMLDEWRALQAGLALRCEVGLAADAFVFADQAADPTGAKPWGPNAMTRAFERARAKVPGMGHMRLHDLRHAHATLLVDAGVNQIAVAERLGHSSLAMMPRYAHRTTRADREAADIMGRVLG